MKALGLHQPYAYLIRAGIKTIETRFWSTPYRGPVLICSTKSTSPGGLDLLVNLRASGYKVSTAAMADVGTMQCVVDLIDCRMGTEADEEAACCRLWDYDKQGKLVQKYAMVLANVQPVVKHPVKCGRKWFTVDDELIEVGDD
jgi:hypothetical protein